MIGKYIKNNSNKLIIIFQSAGRIPIDDLKKILINEVADETIKKHHKRYTWMKFANNNPQFDYLFVEDYFSKSYGWYMIDSGKIIIDEINQKLDEFFADKPYDEIIAYGSSKGGTAALLYGIINKYITHVFALVPQIEVATYFDRYFRAYKKLFYGTTEFNNENVQKNENILNNFIYDKSKEVLNKPTQFVIYTGIKDRQFKQLMKFYSKIKAANNLKIIINTSNIVHDPLVSENLDFIYNTLANISDFNIIEDNITKVNEQIYLYRNLVKKETLPTVTKNIITKKVVEKNTDFANVNFEAYIENSTLYVNLFIEKKDDLLIEYRLFDKSLMVEKISYQKEPTAKFKLNRFADFKLGILIKNEKTKELYSFSTEIISFKLNNAHSYLNNLYNYNFQEGQKIILNIAKNEELKNKEIANVLERLNVISSFDTNIINELYKENIASISLYGLYDELAIVKNMWLMLRYNKNMKYKYLLGDCNFNYFVSNPKIDKIEHNVLNEKLIFEKSDVILVCTTKKDKKMIDSLKEKTNAKVIHLNDVINKIIKQKFIIEPVIKFKEKNPNVNIIIVKTPKIKSIKNRSENEQFIIENEISISTIREEILLEKPKIPLALSRFNISFQQIKEVTGIYYKVLKNGLYYLEDSEGKFVNVVNNFRLTTDQPSKFENTIYCFGNSIVFGIGNKDEETIPSNLQRIINKHYKNSKYSVMNCCNFSATDYDYQYELMNSIEYQENDLVVLFLSDEIIEVLKNDFIICNTQSSFERPHDMGEIFIDRVHVNKIANKQIAELLFKTIIDNNLLKNDKKTSVGTKQLELKSTPDKRSIIPDDQLPELKKYKELLLENRANTNGKKIGAIVMNCNPFTLGHRYLIETSALQVNHLYVFAVEEDKSYFPFQDRYKLIQEGTKDLKNVTVIPSGKFIISSLTFSDYFNKEKLNAKTINMSDDVIVFAEEIAPTLGINIRFVGDEPFCNVTRQYNATLNRILPKYKIAFEVISRKESGGEPISASRVRRLLREKKFAEIAAIVPDTTLSYLIKKFN